MRKRILNANCPRRRARTRRGERVGGGGLKGVPHGERPSVACFGDLEDVPWNSARSGRRAERTGAYSDRADRLNPNIVFSKRYSYQRRGHLTVSEVVSYRLTLPRAMEFGGWSGRLDLDRLLLNVPIQVPKMIPDTISCVQMYGHSWSGNLGRAPQTDRRNPRKPSSRHLHRRRRHRAPSSSVTRHVIRRRLIAH